jgi:hypothetical protein
MAAAAYLVLVEARSSHRLLSKIRHEFLKGAIPYPAESVDQQHSSRLYRTFAFSRVAGPGLDPAAVWAGEGVDNFSLTVYPPNPFDGVVPFGKNSATPHPNPTPHPLLTLARPRPPAQRVCDRSLRPLLTENYRRIASQSCAFRRRLRQ